LGSWPEIILVVTLFFDRIEVARNFPLKLNFKPGLGIEKIMALLVRPNPSDHTKYLTVKAFEPTYVALIIDKGIT